MKNAHGVEPTQFMKRKDIRYSIDCHPDYGPTFGGDICIRDQCNEGNSCYIENNGTHVYECHPQYKKSLFVNSAGTDEKNYFSVLDYEVFGIDYKDKYTINHLCKYPDIIWKYNETSNISEEALKQFDDDVGLLNDLDTISCKDISIRLKISNYYLKNPSELLPDTQIVNQQYDDKLREWIGSDRKWTLIYRASEHGYTAKSFHEYCDDKGPTLIVIKSSGGWIFGGYTTQSWEVTYYDEYVGGIYYDMI